MPGHAVRLLAGLSFIIVGLGSAALGQGVRLPWGQQSDMVAWESFVQIVAPAGQPQSAKVEFETWATDSDIYTASPHWPSIGAAKQLQVSTLSADRHSVARPKVYSPSECTQNNKDVAQAAEFPADGCIRLDVRRNWASFQYIVSNNLYSRAGLAAAFQKGLKVDLPADAIEVKGAWLRISDVMGWVNLTEEQVEDLYYTNTATVSGTTEKFALVSLDITTKQIKDWVWANFEHQKNPGRCDDIGCHDSFGATAPDVQPQSPLWQRYGECQKTTALAAMFTNAGISPIWKNYCLKGSQITFVNASGTATLLGNSVIEAIIAGVPIRQSSCIACHAYASFNKTGESNQDAATAKYVGNVDQTKLKGWATNDFLWGVQFAR
jgi:cytochrome c551/c552